MAKLVMHYADGTGFIWEIPEPGNDEVALLPADLFIAIEDELGAGRSFHDGETE